MMQPEHQALWEAIQKQSDKGMKKYGVPVSVEDYSLEGWLDHLEEELIDSLIYIRQARKKLKRMEQKG